MTQVSPVCTAKGLSDIRIGVNGAVGATDSYHIQIENRNTEAEVILVEYPFELMVNESCAFIKPRSAPGVKCTGLELLHMLGGWKFPRGRN